MGLVSERKKGPLVDSVSVLMPSDDALVSECIGLLHCRGFAILPDREPLRRLQLHEMFKCPSLR